MIDGVKRFLHIGSPPPVPPPQPPQPVVPPPSAPHPGITTPPPGAALPPTSTPQEARSAADRVWNMNLDDGNGPLEDGQVHNAATRVHDGAADLEATRQLFANEGQVEAKLAGMPAEQQQQYRNLEATLEHDPQAHLALQVMLLEGKLTDDSAARTTSQPPQQTLLQALNTANTAPTDPKIDRNALMGELVRECAQPSSIHQENKNTCTVTTMQIMTANQRPAEYVRIVSGLAAPPKDGHPPEVTLADGSKLSRPPGLENDDQSQRSASSRLWQGSLMDFAAKKARADAHYDNAADNFQDAQGNVLRNDGMTEAMLANVATALAKTGYRSADSQYVAANLQGAVDTSLQANPNAPVHVNMRMGNYEMDGTGGTLKDVTVTRGPNNTYKVKDAQGHTTSMSAAEFARRLNGVAGNTVTQAQASDVMWQQLNAELGAGHQTSVALWHGSIDQHGAGDGSHQVLVTRVDTTQNRVYFTNPHGDEESMPVSEFRARMHGMVYT